MDFTWSEEQAELYERVLSFARKELNQNVRERDRAHHFGREEWAKCGAFGLCGLCVPEAYGGMGLDVLTTARVVEAFGRGCEDMGLVFSVAAHLFAVAAPIFAHGSDALRAELLPGLSRGTRIGANAITEAEAGSDVFALGTRAVRVGEDYLLTGTKSYVTNAPVADLFLVYAQTNPDFGFMGLSAFAVDRDTPGLTVGRPFDKVGLTTSPTSSIYLDECRVPARRLIGAEGDGARVFTGSMHWERACLFAGYLGVMDRQLAQAVAHARERRQSGKAIGKYQAVAHRVAAMKQRLEAARLLLYHACWLRDRGQEATLEISLAKVAISEGAIQSGLDLIQILGGNGVMREFDAERTLRDALPATIFSGTSEIQRSLIAERLGL